MGDAVDVKAADGVQEEEEGGGELAPEHQSEADECDLVPEEDHKTQKARRGEDERDEEEDGAQGPLAPCVEVLTHLGYHEELQAKNGSHHGQGTPAADQDHAHSQPWHMRLTQVSEALWPSLIEGGTEVPQPKEAVLSQEPVAITDGDRGEDHGQGSTHDDEGPDEGFKERPMGPPLAQQPLGLHSDGSHAACTGARPRSRLAPSRRSAAAAGVCLGTSPGGRSGTAAGRARPRGGRQHSKQSN